MKQSRVTKGLDDPKNPAEVADEIHREFLQQLFAAHLIACNSGGDGQIRNIIGKSVFVVSLNPNDRSEFPGEVALVQLNHGDLELWVSWKANKDYAVHRVQFKQTSTGQRSWIGEDSSPVYLRFAKT